MAVNWPRVVTLGGGHGQAQLLAALRRLPCRTTAIVSVADDGGCSGKLRRELGMPPPGDLRRCACALATRRERARQLEARLADGRSLGNLWLAERHARHADLQRAADELGCWLGVRGRICPASLAACTLVADLVDGTRAVGELAVAAHRARVRSLSVHAPQAANPAARCAIANADLIVLGPGSFYTSTLAAVLTPGIASAIQSSRAPKLLIQNLCAEDAKTAGFGPRDYLAELARHSGIRAFLLGVHGQRRSASERHDPGELATALAQIVAGTSPHTLARAS